MTTDRVITLLTTCVEDASEALGVRDGDRAYQGLQRARSLLDTTAEAVQWANLDPRELSAVDCSKLVQLWQLYASTLNNLACLEQLDAEEGGGGSLGPAAAVERCCGLLARAVSVDAALTAFAAPHLCTFAVDLHARCTSLLNLAVAAAAARRLVACSGGGDVCVCVCVFGWACCLLSFV